MVFEIISIYKKTKGLSENKINEFIDELISFSKLKKTPLSLETFGAFLDTDLGAIFIMNPNEELFIPGVGYSSLRKMN